MYSPKVISFITYALECSVYVEPNDPGLFYDELIEAGSRAGYGAGEIGDNLQNVATLYMGRHKILPNIATAMWDLFLFAEEPDYRKYEAFHFVYSEMDERIKADGGALAQLDRMALIARGVSTGINSHDIEVAIRIAVLSGKLLEKDSILRSKYKSVMGLTDQRNFAGRVNRMPEKAKAYEIVADIIGRRTDGRPKYAEPMKSFAEALGKLGYPNMRLWWSQMVGELDRSDTTSSSVSSVVLAAALIEGALTFAAKFARARQLAVFQSKDFDRDPRSWKIDELVASAATGNSDAILDAATRSRADLIIRSRRRIHAGRMLSEYPSGPPDVRPEDARDAKATAEIVIRAVLDWLDKYT